MSLFRLTVLSSALVCLLALPHTASAQTSVFATATLTGYGYIPACTNALYTHGSSGGFTAGVDHNFHKDSKLILGMDGRASYSPGSKGGTNELVSFRIGLVPDRIVLRPYFQVGFGVISAVPLSQDPTYTAVNNGHGLYFVPNYKRYTNFAESEDFGLDIKLTNHLDLRAIELGAVLGISGGDATATGTVSAGLVYHLHPLGRTRKP